MLNKLLFWVILHTFLSAADFFSKLAFQIFQGYKSVLIQIKGLFNIKAALVSVNITLLNDLKKWLRPVISKSNQSTGWKAKQNTFLPAVQIISFHISTQKKQT